MITDKKVDWGHNNHMDYIHINPIKHGYVSRASSWKYSSIHRYIEKGMIDANWACQTDDFEMSHFGERPHVP